MGKRAKNSTRISQWIHHNYRGVFPANTAWKITVGSRGTKVVLAISEEVSRAYRELTIQTASHYDSHVRRRIDTYTGKVYIRPVHCETSLQSESIHWRNGSLISRFDVSPVLSSPSIASDGQDGNYTRPSQRVWKAWWKAESHETIKKNKKNKKTTTIDRCVTEDSTRCFRNKKKKSIGKNDRNVLSLSFTAEPRASVCRLPLPRNLEENRSKHPAGSSPIISDTSKTWTWRDGDFSRCGIESRRLDLPVRHEYSRGRECHFMQFIQCKVNQPAAAAVERCDRCWLFACVNPE